MAVESPADIVVLGLNRLSIEAGLYARFLGYRVTLMGNEFSVEWMEGEAIDSSDNPATRTTTLGLKALEAQGNLFEETELIDLKSLEQKYVSAIAASDLLADCVISGCLSMDVRIGESELPDDLDEDVEYDTKVFELNSVCQGNDEGQKHFADVLIDARTATEVNSFSVKCEFDTARDAEKTDGPSRLIHNVADYYRLGGTEEYSFSKGTNDIRDLFRILGDSSTLDLYAN